MVDLLEEWLNASSAFENVALDYLDHFTVKTGHRYKKGDIFRLYAYQREQSFSKYYQNCFL